MRVSREGRANQLRDYSEALISSLLLVGGTELIHVNLDHRWEQYFWEQQCDLERYVTEGRV